MAGQYDIVNGSKIDFRLDQEKHLYIAECEGKAFGLLNQIKKGSKRQLKKIGNEFSGVVLRTVPEQYLLEVLVRTTEYGDGDLTEFKPVARRHEAYVSAFMVLGVTNQ